MSEQFSLRELREWDGGFNSARHREAVLALVDAVETAIAEIEHADNCPLCRGSAPDCVDGLNAGADTQDALARFKDYGETA